MRKNFRIFKGRGLQMSFPNGYTISIQFGQYNYCDHYVIDNPKYKNLTEAEYGGIGSDTAECAIIDPAGNLINLGDPLEGNGDNCIKPYLTSAEALILINYAAGLPAWKIPKEDKDA